MCSRAMTLIKIIRLVLLTGFCSLSLWAGAQEPLKPEFLITPTRCIALHQGQICYQKFNIIWRTSNYSDYCLYQKGNEQAIYCWQAANQGSLGYDFAHNSTQTLQLINIKEKILVSESTIEVAWVYKANTRRKTHWRLF
jgi:Protein of unknown function (DUF3019)